MPEGGINLNIAEREHSHGDGPLLVVADGDEIARIGHYAHHVTLLNAFLHALNGSGEHPRMEAA